MPSFPHPRSVTICEINRDLITAESLSDDVAKDTYGKILGMVFSPLRFQSDQLVQPPSPDHDAEQVVTTSPTKGFLQNLQGIINLTPLFRPNHVNLLPEVDLQGVSWHQHKHVVALISGPNQVIIHDFEDLEGKEPCILANESQGEVKVLEWRPNSGRQLAVACKGGICIWAASFPGTAASIRSGSSSFLGTPSRGSGIQYTLVDFLQSHNEEQISVLSWSPDGRYPNNLYSDFQLWLNFGDSTLHEYGGFPAIHHCHPYLASGSYESSSFTIWDVSQGLGTPIRRGLGGISMLKWSPTGDYFFSAKFDGTFYLWETNTWTSEPWSSTSGFVKGASWDPDGRMILLAFSKSSTMGSIHFASKPPSLDVHLLPVELPEMTSLTNSQGIEMIAWDASGERLAISFKDGGDLYWGLIAIYDVRRTPLISASLIGFIRGPGDKPKPVAFSFHDKFKQGPLLFVCWSSGFCCTYPLIFRSHVLT